MKADLTHKQLEDFLLSKPGTKLEYPFGEEAAVYKVGPPSAESGAAKMFAIIAEGKTPVRLSLKCDPQLAEHLREKYDEVQPGYHLNKKHWNTIVITGQLEKKEIFDLINHSYDLVIDKLPKEDKAKLKNS